MKKFELLFLDKTSQTVEASDLHGAWVIGKIVAAQRGTYLYKVVEK